MSGTYNVVMGDRGRIVIPAELRERLQLHAGVPLLIIGTDRGLVLADRAQVLQMVRDDLAGLDLVTELLAERRANAASDDVA